MLLFYESFPVMETSVCKTSPQDSRLTTPPPQDEDMAKMPMASLTLDPAEYRSEAIDDSFHDKKGMIIQFLNGSCPGAASVIGGIRTNLEDIRKVPLYLQQNKPLIKQHAAKALLDHWKDLNYAMGCNEHITIEDFGMSFTVASISPLGAKLNPLQRTEGPLFFCHLPAMVDPQVVIHSDWNTNVEGMAVHIINAYVTLLPPHQRRTYVMRKDREDRAAAAAAKAAASAPKPVVLQQTGYGSASKKPKPNPPSNASSSSARSAPHPNRPLPETHALRVEMSQLYDLVTRVQRQIVPTIPSPALPTPRTPLWPRQNQGPDLPDGL